MGNSEKDAISLVIQEKNAAGGIRGEKIEPVYGDDGGKPEEDSQHDQTVDFARRRSSHHRKHQ